MSHKLISLNPDLKRLRDEGYNISITNGHLMVREVPYVRANREIALGMLVTPLGDMAGERTSKPENHVIYFAGEHPCDKDGKPLGSIQHTVSRQTLAAGIEVDRSFSNKPPNGYQDYYEKVVNYVRIIENQAKAINPDVTAKTFKVIALSDPDVVFNYLDTNSSRSGIESLTTRLKDQKVGIIGLGGTGSYVLDFICKSPIMEIHLFDGDYFHSHNAFRSPGAASVDSLNTNPKKVFYLHEIYARIHKNITPHDVFLSEEYLANLERLSFVFICIDNSESKRLIVTYLLEHSIPFIDVGIGINMTHDKLTGAARVTLVTPSKHDHIENRIQFLDGGRDDYDQNIQISEINALNAALAVIKWKKLLGFYHDLGGEHNGVYEININKIVNDETDS